MRAGLVGLEEDFLANHHFDSRRWRSVELRAGDVVISSWAKSGTTWLQQVVCQIIHKGDPQIRVNEISPWVDFRLTPLDELRASLGRQSYRRVLKSHLPANHLPLLSKMKYLYIARHPIDVAWSWYRHHRNFTADTLRELNETPGRIGPPLGDPDSTFARYFERWVREDGAPFHPYWQNVASWWEVRSEKNIKIVHFHDMRTDFDSTVRSIANFIGERIDSDLLAVIRDLASIAQMREKADAIVPFKGKIFRGGARSFIGNGESRQWAEELDPEHVAMCEEESIRKLDPECREWLFRS